MDSPLDRPASSSAAAAVPDSDTPEGAPAPNALRWPVLLLGLPLIALDAFWVIAAEKVGFGPYFTTISLFANVLFILTVLIIFNAVLRKVAPRWSVSQAELICLYSMVAVGAALAGHDMVPSLIQMLGHPYRFDNTGNGWLGRFGQYLPAPLMVSDVDVLAGYYQGHSSFYLPQHWKAWLRPSLIWSCFTVVLVWTMMCINVLVRKGWQDREKLPFPVVEIPIQMTDPSGRLWKNSLFWVGFGLCATLEIWNGLAYLYPNLPAIDLKHHNVQGQGIFATRPWNATGFTCYSFYPFAVGLGYLLPLDLLFSFWFFYLFWKGQMVLSAAMAWDVTPDFPFVREQSFGGWVAILAFLLWNGRQYFSEMWKRILGEPSELEDREEALGYRQAFLGMVGGLALITAFFVWAGLSVRWAIAAVVLYFALAVAVTRLRAELGPPVHDLHFTGPDHVLTRVFGTPAFSAQDLTVLSFFYWFNRAYRSHPMPFGVEALKAAKDVRASQKVMFWGLMLATFAGTLSAFWAYLHLAYESGTQAKWNQGSGFAAEAYNRLNGWLQTPQPPNKYGQSAVGVGFVFCALLMVARIRFPWWPLHPIGYAVTSSWSINLVWMPLMIAWAVKALVLRYGGVQLYRRFMPFFLGLILGQVLVGSAWHLLGLYLGIVPYSFWGG